MGTVSTLIQNLDLVLNWKSVARYLRSWNFHRLAAQVSPDDPKTRICRCKSARILILSRKVCQTKSPLSLFPKHQSRTCNTSGTPHRGRQLFASPRFPAGAGQGQTAPWRSKPAAPAPSSRHPAPPGHQFQDTYRTWSTFHLPRGYLPLLPVFETVLQFIVEPVTIFHCVKFLVELVPKEIVTRAHWNILNSSFAVDGMISSMQRSAQRWFPDTNMEPWWDLQWPIVNTNTTQVDYFLTLKWCWQCQFLLCVNDDGEYDYWLG